MKFVKYTFVMHLFVQQPGIISVKSVSAVEAFQVHQKVDESGEAEDVSHEPCRHFHHFASQCPAGHCLMYAIIKCMYASIVLCILLQYRCEKSVCT